MRVAKSVEYSTATRDSAVPTYSNTTAAEKKKLYFCTSNEKYYYYNEISRAWVEVDDQCVYSAFIQTANGFKLSGIVEIDGDLITKGTISADRISTNIAQVNGNLNIGNSDDDVEKELRFSGAAVIKTFFDGISPPTGIKISASKIDLEAYKLDLSDCGEIIWGSNKPVAIFG